jgi:hypothetical protein
MPMDPTLGSRLISTLLAIRQNRDQEQTNALERERLRYGIDRSKKSDKILQDFEKQARAPMSSTQAPPVTPEPMTLAIQTPELGGTGGAPMGGPAPYTPSAVPFKQPPNYVMGGGIGINGSAAKVRAAQQAKAFNEARVGSLFDENMQRLSPQSGGISTADAALLAQAGDGGNRLLEVLTGMRTSDEATRRAALTGAGQERNLLAEQDRHYSRLDYDERKHADDLGVNKANVGLRKGELGLNTSKFEREKLVEGATADEVATNAGKKRKAEKAGEIAAQTEAGVNQAQRAIAREAAAMARTQVQAGVSRANALTSAQQQLTREAMGNGWDVAEAMGAFNMELEKGGFFGGKGKVRATAPAAAPVQAPTAPVPAPSAAPVQAPQGPPDVQAAMATLTAMKAELARRKGAKRGR